MPFPNKCCCSVVKNHSLVWKKKTKDSLFWKSPSILNGPAEGAKFNIICGCASDRGSTVATSLVGLRAGGDTWDHTNYKSVSWTKIEQILVERRGIRGQLQFKLQIDYGRWGAQRCPGWLFSTNHKFYRKRFQVFLYDLSIDDDRDPLERVLFKHPSDLGEDLVSS